MAKSTVYTHAVVGTYSFTEEASVTLFTSEAAAIKYLRDTYTSERAEDKAMGNISNGEYTINGTYAKITNYPRSGGEPEISEWRVTSNISICPEIGSGTAMPKPTMLTYVGANGVKSCCDVMRQDNVVVVKERQDNPGVSITNALEPLAAKVCEEYGIAPEDLDLYELYVFDTPDHVALSHILFADDAISGPRWTEIPKETFEKNLFSLAPLCNNSSFGE